MIDNGIPSLRSDRLSTVVPTCTYAGGAVIDPEQTLFLWRSTATEKATGGTLAFLSTPYGKRGHFFEAWENGGEAWDRIKVTARDCPRISPEFLTEEQLTMPHNWYASEYGCEFTDTIDAIFTHELIVAALSDEVHPLFLEV